MTTPENNPKRATTITLRQEKAPTRCEVCHQSDVFNRETGMCQRCKHLKPMQAAHCGICRRQDLFDRETGFCRRCEYTTSFPCKQGDSPRVRWAKRFLLISGICFSIAFGSCVSGSYFFFGQIFPVFLILTFLFLFAGLIGNLLDQSQSSKKQK